MTIRLPATATVLRNHAGKDRLYPHWSFSHIYQISTQYVPNFHGKLQASGLMGYHEAVDRHVVHDQGDKTAICWLGKSGARKTLAFEFQWFRWRQRHGYGGCLTPEVNR